MIPSQILDAARTLNPRIQLRDIWFILRQFTNRELVQCLNPTAPTGKLFFWTDKGKKVVHKAFGMTIEKLPTGIDWHKYARIIRGKTRRAVLSELRKPQFFKNGATATDIKRSLGKHYPLGLNATIRALKELVQDGMVKLHDADISKTRAKKYTIRPHGNAVAELINRQGK